MRRSSTIRNFLQCLALCGLALVARPAFAEDEQGRFSLVELGARGGFSNTSFPSRGIPDDDGATGGILGPELKLNLRLGPALAFAEGFWNPVQSGLAYRARAGFVLGGLSWWALSELVSQTQVGNQILTETRLHLTKEVPAIYGLMLAGGPIGTREMLQPASLGKPQQKQTPGTLLPVEAGFALMTPQLDLVAAPEYEVTKGHPGLHVLLKIGFPVDRSILYCRFDEEHFFASSGDAKIDNVFTFSIGYGSSVGVSTSE